jgi:hypothetical protein
MARCRINVLSNLQIVSIFRHYPPAPPYLDVGENRLTYESVRRAQFITLEFDERGVPLSSAAYRRNGMERASGTDKRRPKRCLYSLKAQAADFTSSIQLSTKFASHCLPQMPTGKWSDERLVTPAGMDANHPVFAEDGAGTVWVAYQTGGLWSGGDVYVISMNGQAVGDGRLNSNDPYPLPFPRSAVDTT